MARRKQSKRTTVKDIRTILRLTQEGLSVREISDRRQEQSERRRDHIAELNKRASESKLRLKRLYDAIEAGVADIDDPALKDRIDGLKAIRDQAKADTERAQAMLDNSGSKAITPQMVRTFARTARQRIRLEGGGYRRDHLRALAQRVEVAEGVGFEPTVRLHAHTLSKRAP